MQKKHLRKNFVCAILYANEQQKCVSPVFGLAHFFVFDFGRFLIL